MKHLAPGAHPDARGTTFVAFATRAREVAVRLFDAHGVAARTEPLVAAVGEGRFERHVEGVRPGDLYKLVVDERELPDPYARFLPFGVHGPATVIAPPREPVPALASAPPLSQWAIYELHVGTFSPEGTYRGAQARLDAIVELGFTAIELLPVAAFDGARGWGYDGVALYAPYAPYGSPDELRDLVRAAHDSGIAVLLDVVYNHLGPSGNYLGSYAPEYFASDITTPWGPAPDFAHAPMRRLVVDNVRYWLEEFGFDGLRLDATHAIVDRSSRHVLREIADLAHAMTPPRRVFFEDERNDPSIVTELGADATWSDDVHHQVHVLSTRERDGYYEAYDGTPAAIARAIREGWTFTGQAFSPWKGKLRGAPMRGLVPENLVYALQNHDQVGNRALGARLSHDIGIEAYGALSVLFLFLPAIPLVFMGQEWAASTPFLFFTDHESPLGDAIREGRREEFKAFAAFTDPDVRDHIPDPQAKSTFERSRLRWDEREHEPHAHVLATYRAMMRLRRTDPVLSARATWEDVDAVAHGEVVEVVRKHGPLTRRCLVSFAASESIVSVPSTSRVLFASGRYESGRLGSRSAVVLADE